MAASSRITSLAEHLLDMAKEKRAPIRVEKIARIAGATIRKGRLPDDLSGFLMRENTPPIIGVNTAHRPTRQRFTIAHELGHLLLHTGSSYVDRSFPIFFRDSRSGSAEIRVEIEANQFAADLLMPQFLLNEFAREPVDIDGDEHVRELAIHFKVSPQAMIFRLMNLGLATPAPVESKRSRLGSRPAKR